MVLKARTRKRLADMVEINYDRIVKNMGLSVEVDFGDQILWTPRELIGEVTENTIEVVEWFAIDKGLV